MNERLEKTAAALRRRGFEALVFDSGKAACDHIMSELPEAAEVGVGGCETAVEIGLVDALHAAGCTVHTHRGVPGPKTPPIRRAELLAPYFVCSANALTEDGLIVEIDGTGNRVAAMCYGPSVVYLVVGKNKIVEGGYQQAVRRIKQVACPKNARRLGLDTPCAKDGCDVSACNSFMCAMTFAFDPAPSGKTTKVLLIDEDLGY